MTYSKEIIGQRIKEARGRMTKAKLAEECGIQQYQTITAWETGNAIPSLERLLKLCDILHCDMGYLLGEYPEKNRIKAEICTKTGLSESAVDKLVMLNSSKCSFGSQFISFYSSFIADTSIWGMLAYLPGLIMDIEQNGLNEDQEKIFQNQEEAIRFYKYQMQDCLMEFIHNYFEDMELIKPK